MTRQDLVKAILKNDEPWSCPNDENCKTDSCIECAENILAEYERKIRADVIDEIKAYVSKKTDEMNMRTKIAEEKAESKIKRRIISWKIKMYRKTSRKKQRKHLMKLQQI